MSTFGEVSWNDDVFGGDGKKNANNKDLFLRLDEGSNEMRIVTQPFQYLVHKIKKDANNPKDFGQKVSCSAAHGSCPACESGDKAKPRWLLGVISRKTGTYKILDISFAVFSQIRKYARNTARWGDPTKYDIDIVVDKNGSPMSYYSVQAISKEPLSAADQVIKDAADLDDLKRRVTPLTPEQVQKRMDKIAGVDTGASAPAATAAASTAKKAAPKAAAKTATVSLEDDSDLGESFPDYNNGQSA
jgi:hypothetical protein